MGLEDLVHQCEPYKMFEEHIASVRMSLGPVQLPASGKTERRDGQEHCALGDKSKLAAVRAARSALFQDLQ
jgi:hypothetical protein